ncbi:MAG: PAS domain-containing protein [Rhodobiaceae bacterium]|nr:PAS domain-containing protein [Rhodobiaceae bacterium]
MALDRELKFIGMNKAYLAVTQRDRKGLAGKHVFDVFPESGERRLVFQEAFQKALSGQANEVIRQPFSIPRPDSEGGGMREVWWTCFHMPIYDSDGDICGVVQKAVDVTNEMRLDLVQQSLMREFDHRVKNILSTVTAIARRTASGAESLERFAEDFQDRIEAMARTHSSLVQDGWSEVDISVLLRQELEPYRSPDRKIEFGGPQVSVNRRHAQTLGMAFHELTTNAAKYGALSSDEGALNVSWTIDPVANEVELVWREDGMEDLSVPQTQGFGSTIIDRLLPADMSAVVKRDFLPTGLVCTIRFQADGGVPATAKPILPNNSDPVANGITGA